MAGTIVLDCCSAVFITKISFYNDTVNNKSEVVMFHLSKLIYNQIVTLFPDIHTIKPYQKINLKRYDLEDMELIVLESGINKIDFILSQYVLTNGCLVPNPTVEMILLPENRTATVMVYKDRNFTYRYLPRDEIENAEANSYVNRLVYEWLKDLSCGSKYGLNLRRILH